MQGVKIKKKMLYSLMLPYLLVGITLSVYLGYRYCLSVREVRQDYESESWRVLTKVSQEVDYLLNDVENLALEIQLNDRLMRPVSIKQGKRDGVENYAIAMALQELKNVKKFNYLIEDIILYYRQGDFFLNPNSIRTERGIYEDYVTNKTVEFEEWSGHLTGLNPKGRLMTVGDSVFYIVTVPINEKTENCNIIIKIDSRGFKELIQPYNVDNERIIFLFDTDMQPIIDGSDGKKVFEEALLSDEMMSLKSQKTGIQYALWDDEKKCNEKLTYINALYLSCGLLFGILIFVGMYFVSLNYKKILSIIERLMKSNEKRDVGKCSEMDYINDALSALEEKIQGQEAVILNDYVRKALYGLIEDDNNYKQFILEHQQLGCNPSVIVVFENNVVKERSAKEIKLDLFIIENVMRDVFEDKLMCYVIPVYNWEIVILNWCVDKEFDIKYVLRGLEQMRGFLEKYLDIYYTIGVSNCVYGIQQFARGYREAIVAIENKMILGSQCVIYYDNVKECRHSFEYTKDMEQQLKNYIYLGDEEKSTAFIASIFEEAFGDNSITPESGKLLMVDLLKTIHEVSKELNFSFEIEFVSILKGKYTVWYIKDKIQIAVQELCHKAEKQIDNTRNRDTQIKQYIMQNYNNPELSVAMIAEAFRLNPSYLSRVFKEDTDENLLNYINRYRINCVKELLETTDDTITRIASETGFVNAAALNRIFKKYEGVTPGQYKIIHKSVTSDIPTSGIKE